MNPPYDRRRLPDLHTLGGTPTYVHSFENVPRDPNGPPIPLIWIVEFKDGFARYCVDHYAYDALWPTGTTVPYPEWGWVCSSHTVTTIYPYGSASPRTLPPAILDVEVKYSNGGRNLAEYIRNGVRAAIENTCTCSTRAIMIQGCPRERGGKECVQL